MKWGGSLQLARPISLGELEMYVRALHGFHHYGNVRRGQVLEVTPDVAAQLIANSLVVEMQEQPAAPVPPPAPVPVAVKEDHGVAPFVSSPSGGQAGEGKPQSSSRRGRPRKTKT